MDLTLIVLIIVVGGMRLLAHYFPAIMAWIFSRFPRHFKPHP